MNGQSPSRVPRSFMCVALEDAERDIVLLEGLSQKEASYATTYYQDVGF